MSYCRITGRSRGLPKPNYFPLLPPISPADAKRFCRVTGKSYGLPTHHYIPVLLGFHGRSSGSSSQTKCKITTKSEGLEAHHYTAGVVLGGERRRHAVLEDFRYVFPVLDGDGEQQRALRRLLESKAAPQDVGGFVYTVAERRCSLVFPAGLEAAVRDGDVRDVMLSRDRDSLLLRLRRGKSLAVDFRELHELDEAALYEGWGPSEEVARERERREAESRERKKRRQEGLSYAKRIFEEKEKAAEEEESKAAKQVKLRSVKRKEEKLNWKQVGRRHEEGCSRRNGIVSSVCAWTGTAKRPLDRELDAAILEESEFAPLAEKLPTPASLGIEPQSFDLEGSQQPRRPVSEETGGFESISVIEPFVPLTAKPDACLQQALRAISARDLDATADVYSRFGGQEAASALLDALLPRIDEIPRLVEAINSNAGEATSVHKVKGLKIDVDAARRFVTGQLLHTPQGETFVPGQTLRTPQGVDTFVPGFTVNTPDGPMLVPGQIVHVREDKVGKVTAVFVAGQTLPTGRGDEEEEEEEFVQGQTMHTRDGAKFVPGQTVITREGPKFLAGQVVNEKTFVPGQLVATPDGCQFVAGQTMSDELLGQQIFVPGQSYQEGNAGTWEFMPGQSLKMEDGTRRFVAGQTMRTSDGLQFVPGRSVTLDSGETHFVPGITVESTEGEGRKFVAGMELRTPDGQIKFVEGQIVKTPTGDKFLPGSVTFDENGFRFAVAASLNDVNFIDTDTTTTRGIAIDPKTASVVGIPDSQSEIFGHIVQTETGVEFIANAELPSSFVGSSKKKKVIPGQLVRGKDGVRFVPGIMTDDGFLPGQAVNTESGEQFVPGQVIDTRNGPKFVPGQMVDTRSGPKFVPGQTVSTADGPQFVPGQIVETKAGPTFIPGQVISTEQEGSRFVPGQVVDTPEGPRFVPGRVIESDEHGVVFVPGQIVQTEEGPKFVAPDLIDTPEGELEFSVQGFEVTPEELKLLRPYSVGGGSGCNKTEPTIDARMLRQLSDAGLAVGRSVSLEIPHVDVDSSNGAANVELDCAIDIAEGLGLRGQQAVKMAQVVATIANLADKIVHRKFRDEGFRGRRASALASCQSGLMGNGEANGEDDKVQDALKSTLASAVMALMEERLSRGSLANGHESSDGIGNGGESKRDFVFSAISEALQVFSGHCDVSLEQSVEEFLQALLLPRKRNSLCQSAIEEVLHANSANKIEVLRSTLVADLLLKDDVVLDRLARVLEEEDDDDDGGGDDDVVGAAFRCVSRNDTELISRVLRKVQEDVAGLETERAAAGCVRRAIVEAVREHSEARLREILEDDEGATVKKLLLQAVGLARALGMSRVAASLLAVANDESSRKALVGDEVALDVLRRLTVMRKLAEERPRLVAALGELETADGAERARSDPHLRALVRESAALMIVPEEEEDTARPLESSRDVPAALMRPDNALAMEDFVTRRGRGSASATFMIIKHGLQAVVPREAARSVLTGRVPYTLLDERGVQRFEPLHVFSALRLSKPAAHRFSMYCCPIAKLQDEEEESYAQSEMMTRTSSCDSSATILDRGSCDGVDLRSFAERRTSKEHTPSLRRIRRGAPKSENYVVVKEHTSDGFSVEVGDFVEAVEYAADSTK